MKSKGNGTPQQCIANLINLFQYEVPYARLKGMPADIIDKPDDEAATIARNHATWLISNYEPRVKINNININKDQSDRLIITPDVTVIG